MDNVPPKQPANIVDIRSTNKKDMSLPQSLINATNELQTNSADFTDVFEIGPIGHIRLPGSWFKGEEKKHVVGRSDFVSYWNSNNHEVKFCFFFRGSLTSNTAAQDFKAALSLEPHKLSAKEIESLAEILWDKANSNKFSLLLAKTEDLNDRRVLMVEGSFKDWGLFTRSYFIDCDKSGSIVQEVFFIAPKGDYQKYYIQADKAFNSIFWRY